MILNKILIQKRKEIILNKSTVSIQQLISSEHYSRKCISLKEKMEHDQYSIIAEYKRKSPSAGNFTNFTLEDAIDFYHQMNASAISVLTDFQFFGGVAQDVLDTRKLSSLPILRKEFIIDEYQIHETKAMGADIILLIAKCLSKTELISLARLAKEIGLEVLLEVHSLHEFENYNNEYIDFIGINNRNLDTLTCDLEVSRSLIKKMNKSTCFISESGIKTNEEILELKDLGFKGFLIGESFLKSNLILK